MLGKIEGRRRRRWQRMNGWMASPTQWTSVWASSRSWWWTGRPGILQSMGSQRVGHNWASELNCWDHLKHCTCASWGTHLVMGYCVQDTCKSFTVKALVLLHEGHMAATSWLCYMRLCYGSILPMLWLWLLHQTRERLCYGCHASQERINVSAVSTAPHISFQLPSLHLTYRGFSEQCEQWDNWCHE